MAAPPGPELGQQLRRQRDHGAVDVADRRPVAEALAEPAKPTRDLPGAARPLAGAAGPAWLPSVG
jgi:hypothetical protein